MQSTTVSSIIMPLSKHFNSRVVTMVAWFTVVVEANCIRLSVSFVSFSRRNTTFSSKVGETGVGETGVGEQGISHVIVLVC